MKYQYPGIRMVFKGTLRYSVSKNSKVLNFEQELPGRHLFRPLAMSTEEFGKKWTSMSCDVREHVTMTSRRSREEIASDVANYIHFQVIDIKGTPVSSLPLFTKMLNKFSASQYLPVIVFYL